MYPWPVAHTYWQGQRFKIYEASLTESSGPAAISSGEDQKGADCWYGTRCFILKNSSASWQA